MPTCCQAIASPSPLEPTREMCFQPPACSSRPMTASRGWNGVPINAGDMDTNAYDAGTEDNSEAKADVPGPPFGGKNHGPDTNPHQPISMHQGIKGVADVTPDFNWTGPVARFSIREVTTTVTTPSRATFDVTVTNINNSMQGLSPLVIATHPASVHAWQMGKLASKGLELLAREGMPDMLASELTGGATDVATTHAHLLPGDSITVRITGNQGDVLSAASMLIQTNDGFTGLDGVPLSEGSTETVAYDAGAEDNTELAADVPGPPFGGKNHGPDRTHTSPSACTRVSKVSPMLLLTSVGQGLWHVSRSRSSRLLRQEAPTPLAEVEVLVLMECPVCPRQALPMPKLLSGC